MNTAIDWGCRPIRHQVSGAPYQPGQAVTVVASAEGDCPLTGVSEYIGKSGVVEYLEYSCGCGQRYPDDPMIGVNFPDRRQQEFWHEELTAAIQPKPIVFPER
jgi:hypothetical protein